MRARIITISYVVLICTFFFHQANYFSSLSYTPVISSVVGREVYDGSGEAALQVDVYCVVRNEQKVG